MARGGGEKLKERARVHLREDGAAAEAVRLGDAGVDLAEAAPLLPAEEQRCAAPRVEAPARRALHAEGRPAPLQQRLQRPLQKEVVGLPAGGAPVRRRREPGRREGQPLPLYRRSAPRGGKEDGP